SRTAVCGHEPVSTPTTRAGSSTPASVDRTCSASSRVKMSLVTTTGRWPAASSRGTRASISAVLPEPTGPPMPMRATPGAWTAPKESAWWAWSCEWGNENAPLSAGEQPQLRLLMTHRHHVEQRRAARDLTDVAVDRLACRLGDHGTRSMQQRL